MKIVLILFIDILLIGYELKAQDTVLLDQTGKVTIQGFESYYRVCNYDFSTKLPSGKFIDYYAKSDKIYGSGDYLNGKRYGYFTIYDIDKKREYYLKYNDNNQIDTISIYNKNGKDVLIKFNDIDNTLIFYDWNDSLNSPLIIDGNGMISYKTTDFSIKGQIKDYRPYGNWIIQNPNFTIVEKYKKGRFISGKGKYSNGKNFETVISNLKYLLVKLDYFENSEKLLLSDFYRKRDYPKLDSLFTPRWHLHSQSDGFIIVEDQASFPGGKENLNVYIQSKLKYPLEAQQNNIKGNVIVSFTIDVDGQVKDPELVKGLGYGCDKVAIELIKDMPDWLPGQQRGKPVPVKFKMPIRFE